MMTSQKQKEKIVISFGFEHLVQDLADEFFAVGGLCDGGSEHLMGQAAHIIVRSQD